MAIKVLCPGCRTLFTVSDKFAGRTGPCPKCKAPFLVEKITKKLGRQLLCNNEDCDYARSEELAETTA